MNIPEYISYNIIMYAIILKKKIMGWDNIYNNLTEGTIYLKKTNYIFDDTFKFIHIHRLGNYRNFYKIKKYVWLKNYKYNKLMYYYQPEINEKKESLYSCGDFGIYYDEDWE